MPALHGNMRVVLTGLPLLSLHWHSSAQPLTEQLEHVCTYEPPGNELPQVNWPLQLAMSLLQGKPTLVFTPPPLVSGQVHDI